MLILLFKVSFEKPVNASKLCLKSFRCFEVSFVVILHRFTTVLISQFMMSLPHDRNQEVNC